MLTLDQIQALHVGDAVVLQDMGNTVDTTVSFISADRLHVSDDFYQFILANCPDGIEILSLPS